MRGREVKRRTKEERKKERNEVMVRRTAVREVMVEKNKQKRIGDIEKKKEIKTKEEKYQVDKKKKKKKKKKSKQR